MKSEADENLFILVSWPMKEMEGMSEMAGHAMLQGRHRGPVPFISQGDFALPGMSGYQDWFIMILRREEEDILFG